MVKSMPSERIQNGQEPNTPFSQIYQRKDILKGMKLTIRIQAHTQNYNCGRYSQRKPQRLREQRMEKLNSQGF